MSLFFRQQLSGEKVKRDWLYYLPSSNNFTALCANFLDLILTKTCWHQLVMAMGNMHLVTWPGTYLLKSTYVVYQYTLLAEKKRRAFAKGFEEQNESDRTY